MKKEKFSLKEAEGKGNIWKINNFDWAVNQAHDLGIKQERERIIMNPDVIAEAHQKNEDQAQAFDEAIHIIDNHFQYEHNTLACVCNVILQKKLKQKKEEMGQL